MALFEESAFLLRHRPLAGERLWLELFSEGHGKIAAVSRRRHTPPYWTELSLSLLRGHGELWTLRGWEERAPSLLLRGKELLAAFYLNELLLYLLPREEPYPELFAAYRKALSELPRDLEVALRGFELELLAAIGYDLPLQESFDPEGRYRYRPGVGFEPSREGEVSGATLLALKARQIKGEPVRSEARRLLRRILAHYLGGRRLRSRELWRSSRP